MNVYNMIRKSKFWYILFFARHYLLGHYMEKQKPELF